MKRKRDDPSARLWSELVTRRLPETARARPDWPVSRDHCFARILLDNACGGAWREHVAPPAWASMPDDRFGRALGLGDAILMGSADLHVLNRRSLAWRGKSRSRTTSPDRLDHARRTVYRRRQSVLAEQPNLFDRDPDDQR